MGRQDKAAAASGGVPDYVKTGTVNIGSGSGSGSSSHSGSSNQSGNSNNGYSNNYSRKN